MSSIAVIGAGITGLTAAFELRKRGLAVRLFEASNEPGGVIRSIRKDGYLAECGPNTLLDTSPKIPELIRAAGLEPLYSFPEAKAKYVVRRGRPIELPSTQLAFLTTPVFSWGAKLRLIREPFIARGAADQEESLGAFVLRRLGQEFLDYAINPFVAGVYAGDPHKLSVREAFGKVYDLEQKYGSLIKGQFLGARERKQRGTVSKDKAAKISFAEGLQSLPRALARSLGDAVQYGVHLQSIESVHERWKLRFEAGGEETFDSVLLAIPAYKLAEIESSGRRLFSFLSAIRYAPISSIVIGFKRAQVAHSLDGFGFLVPEVEGLNILGAIFNSSLFPNRAPAGHVTITVYLGGFRNPSLPFLTADEQLKLVLTDLTKTLGVTGEPTFFHQVTHAKAIPQYEIGYANIRKQIEQVELENPGLYLGGNYRGGVSLSDSILNGLNFTDRIAARLGDGKIVPEMAKSPTLG